MDPADEGIIGQTTLADAEAGFSREQPWARVLAVVPEMILFEGRERVVLALGEVVWLPGGTGGRLEGRGRQFPGMEAREGMMVLRGKGRG
jgi:hypothetical protein